MGMTTITAIVRTEWRKLQNLGLQTPNTYLLHGAESFLSS